MSEAHWSELLEQQKKFIEDEEQETKRQKHKLKHLYKEDLERMIHEHQLKASDQRKMDIRRMNMLIQKQEGLIKNQHLKNQEKQKIRKQIQRQNLKTLEDRRNQVFQSEEKEKNLYHQRYKKIMTELSQEQQTKLKHKNEERNVISNALDEQIYETEKKKLFQRIQDQKYAQLQEQIESRKQAGRKKFINKIKYGYYQSPQVYDRTKEIYQSEQQRKKIFLDKMIYGHDDSLELKIKQEQQNKKKGLVKEISQYNRHRHQQKVLNYKHQSLQQALFQQQKNNHINAKNRKQRQESQRQHQLRKIDLKRQLQRQIAQTQQSKKKRNILSEQEKRINQVGSSHTPVLPGLSRDYANRKHQQIIQEFLVLKQ